MLGGCLILGSCLALGGCLMLLGACSSSPLVSPRERSDFNADWRFHLGDGLQAAQPGFADNDWRVLDLPHDWAIEGDFSQENPSGTGGGALPGGVGWYRKTFSVDKADAGKIFRIEFDGVYMNSEVFINGVSLGVRPYGYISFSYDLTPYLKWDEPNVLAVRVDNAEQPNSRWYSGCGIYRNVWLSKTGPIHVGGWGTYVTTSSVDEKQAVLNLATTLVNESDTNENVTVCSSLQDAEGREVAETRSSGKAEAGKEVVFTQQLTVKQPQLWDIDTPYLYTLVTKVMRNEECMDRYTTPVGIRTFSFDARKGFTLNGRQTKINGVCMHHDLGCLGAAVNTRAIERQLQILKEMGCNGIRCSHNPPAPELLDLCDRMGFIVMDEAFDMWRKKKTAHDYARYFNEWHERDLNDFILRDRNHPSVFMWSIGNEVPTQCSPVGYKVAKFLQDICHREDPTRPVTCGMDQVTCVLANGFAAMIDIPGLNYRTQRYKESYDQLPQNLILGSETASTVSSRGVYKFPVEDKKSTKYEDHQCSSYDVEACSWSNIPDEDFALADDNHWTIGQFVWTGFDYLGEPSPYDTDAWPNHSSMFGIIDLASLTKDRYYLYRSVWNKDAETLHILPHWTWPGREGEVTPVFVYTNYPTAELFINGKSYGKQSKNNSSLKNRYRLMWMDAVYEPGEVKVVAYNKEGKAVAEKVVRTAGKPHHIELVSNRNELTADGKDLAYVTVKVVDKDGNPCPTDNRQINFSAKGTGKYRAAANGDPTNLEQFHLPKMHAFNGMLTAILQAGETAGEIVFTAKANGVKAGNIRIQTK